MKSMTILALAAGEGTRMKSALPKVLHRVAGETLMGHVFRAATPLTGSVGIVLGRGADEIKKVLPGNVRIFLQRQRLGSGHAVKCAASWLSRLGGNVLVLCGDAPLIRTETLRALAAKHSEENNSATLLTARVERPQGYGRVVRDAFQRPRAIVEEREATPDQKRIQEINSGTYCFRVNDLLKVLSRLRSDNSKGEYYITDVVELLAKEGKRVGAFCLEGEEEVLGVNDRSELAAAEGILRRRILHHLMKEGVTVMDPASTYVDVGVRVGRDSMLFPQTYLQGNTRIGSGCRLGPFTFLEDCWVGNGAELRAVFASKSRIEPEARVGPFAHLRPNSRLGPRSKVGNFVELKNAHVGAGSKVNHLAYLGDALLGKSVNIGAGVITCNYDGYKKSLTRIGAETFVGSNVNLVAPVRLGKGSVIGAGSTITRDVPAAALALERSSQIIKRQWARQKQRKIRKTSKKAKRP